MNRTQPSDVATAGVAANQSVASINVLVAGMHRSGTSAVAEVLRRAGLFGGDLEDLMPPTAENPAGYWELEKVRLYNDRLLASLGWTWDSPAATPHAVPPARPQFVEEGRRLIKDMTARGSAFYIKDPRLSLLLPWWRQILFDRVVTIVVLRSPDEVAWSLSVRDGFPVPLGAALWSAYHRHLADGLRGLPVIVVDYPALLADPSAVVGEVLRELDRMGVDAPYDEDSASGAIRPSLRRATHPSKAIENEPWAASMQRVYETWSAMAAGGLDRFDLEPHGVDGWEVALLDLHHNFKDEQQRTTVANQAAAASRHQAEAEHAAATAAGAETDFFRVRVGDLQTEREELAHGADELRAERDQLRTTGDALRTTGEALRTTLGSVEAEREELRAAGETLRTTLGSVEAERDELQLRLTATERYGRIGSSFADRHPSLARWVLRPLRAVWLVATFSLWRHLHENPLFDADWYLARYPELHDTGVNPRSHYWSRGAAEGYDPNPLFDTDWYLAQYPDVAVSDLNPLDHYFYFGGEEGRSPSPQFDAAWYLLENPDVRTWGINPLMHYLRYGVRERRRLRPMASASSGSEAQADP